ncbi:hypothetical protein SLA2020_028180 [Shorea laevis]
MHVTRRGVNPKWKRASSTYSSQDPNQIHERRDSSSSCNSLGPTLIGCPLVFWCPHHVNLLLFHKTTSSLYGTTLNVEFFQQENVKQKYALQGKEKNIQYPTTEESKWQKCHFVASARGQQIVHLQQPY